MARRISGERKAAYYIGIALMGLGMLMFAMHVLSFAGAMEGAMDSGSIGMRSNMPSMVTPILAIGLIAVGAFVRSIGARGLAGSGVVLDPEGARDDLEPYSRMAGGMVKDAVDESGLELGGRRAEASDEAPVVVVKIKCRDCGQLNEEDSKFCQECGVEM